MRAKRYYTADIPPVECITRDEPNIVVTRTSYAATTRYRIAGTPAEVGATVQTVKRQYPPSGYGTWAHPPKYISPGRVEVIVDRGNTCE